MQNASKISLCSCVLKLRRAHVSWKSSVQVRRRQWPAKCRALWAVTGPYTKLQPSLKWQQEYRKNLTRIPVARQKTLLWQQKPVVTTKPSVVMPHTCVVTTKFVFFQRKTFLLSQQNCLSLRQPSCCRNIASCQNHDTRIRQDDSTTRKHTTKNRNFFVVIFDWEEAKIT